MLVSFSLCEYICMGVCVKIYMCVNVNVCKKYICVCVCVNVVLMQQGSNNKTHDVANVRIFQDQVCLRLSLQVRRLVTGDTTASYCIQQLLGELQKRM